LIKPTDGTKEAPEPGLADERRIGLGCMALTGIYGRIERRDAAAVVHRALDLGIDHFDTAELYGPYVNEELLAEALGSRSAHVRIATKFGYKLVDGRIAGLDSRPATIRRAVEGSLRRLRRDRIDLLYQHRIDPDVPIEEVVGTMADLISEGKVAALGLSAIDSATLERAQGIHAISAVQNEYSLIQRQPEADLLSVLDSQAITLVAFSPLARGVLCGNVVAASDRDAADYRKSDARFAADRLSATETRLQPLWDIAKNREVTPATVALAWLLAKSPQVLVIPGARSPGQIAASIRAVALRLSAAEQERLDTIGAVVTSSVTP
jgi:aryl-alcohol dehydrogenase-like predicted oxidoreductase